MEAVRWLREAGLDVEHVSAPEKAPDGGAGGVLSIGARAARARFVVQEKRGALYASDLERLRPGPAALRRHGHPLLLAPFVSERVGRMLTAAGWSWADTDGNFDIRAPGLVLRQRRSEVPPKPKRRLLPRGSGSLGIIRALIRSPARTSEQTSVSALSAMARISQPRASQVLASLQDLGLVTKSERGWKADREALLDRFLTEYDGPGGSERYFYSPDQPSEVAALAARVRAGGLAVSADVGPDFLIAWRRPSVLIVYVERDVPPDRLGVVDAQGRHDANVIFRMPLDRSVFATPPLSVDVGDVSVPLADPSQMIWDLHDLGGEDRLEAAGMLREWLLTGP